jgi:hypothetical protein
MTRGAPAIRTGTPMPASRPMPESTDAISFRPAAHHPETIL